jgi:hypothetical protein
MKCHGEQVLTAACGCTGLSGAIRELPLPVLGNYVLPQIIPQQPASGWMPQLAQSLGFDLADALTCHLEIAADLF